MATEDTTLVETLRALTEQSSVEARWDGLQTATRLKVPYPLSFERLWGDILADALRTGDITFAEEYAAPRLGGTITTEHLQRSVNAFLRKGPAPGDWILFTRSQLRAATRQQRKRIYRALRPVVFKDDVEEALLMILAVTLGEVIYLLQMPRAARSLALRIVDRIAAGADAEALQPALAAAMQGVSPHAHRMIENELAHMGVTFL